MIDVRLMADKLRACGSLGLSLWWSYSRGMLSVFSLYMEKSNLPVLPCVWSDRMRPVMFPSFWKGGKCVNDASFFYAFLQYFQQSGIIKGHDSSLKIVYNISIISLPSHWSQKSPQFMLRTGLSSWSYLRIGSARSEQIAWAHSSCLDHVTSSSFSFQLPMLSTRCCSETRFRTKHIRETINGKDSVSWNERMLKVKWNSEF